MSFWLIETIHTDTLDLFKEFRKLNMKFDNWIIS